MRNYRRLYLLMPILALFMLGVVNASFSQEAAAGQAVKYSDIIAAAKTQPGVFTVHQVGESYLFEIPAAALGRDMMWHAELAKMPAGVGGQTGIEVGVALVRWERHANKILVRDFALARRSDDVSAPAGDGGPTSDEYWTPINTAIEESALPPVIMTFDVLAEGPDGSVVIDVTAAIGGDIADFSPTTLLAGGGYAAVAVDPAATYIEWVKAFPRNVAFRTHLTYAVSGGTTSRASVVVHHSITMLPDEPMMPRHFDPRIGYFKVGFEDYSGITEPGVTTQNLICRYRLEKKTPDAAVSEPVKPIVYYVGREVPDRWRPYLKQAIEDWQVAFEAAGFKNAIIAKDAPTPEENPDWDPADTRFSVIRWLAQPTANAMGPNIHDPRTGEILSAHVLLWADVLSLTQQWYFTRCAALDERAQKLPLSDEIIGELLRYAVCHEIGHSLGLRHNHRGSTAYSVEQLRDPEFAEKYGSVASIMSYGRFNYVAQPEDGVKRLIPMIAPYDLFAIDWGYRPVPGATSPGDESGTLNEWAARQAENPLLAFGGEDLSAIVDPNVLTQNIGSDRIEATRLGLMNLDRISDPEFLLAATTEPGKDYGRLQTVYGWLLARRTEMLTSVVALVGGVEETRTFVGGTGAQFHRVPGARQREAVKFVLEHGLKHYGPLADQRLLNMFAPICAVSPIVDSQATLLNALLDDTRYLALQDAITLQPADSYSIGELLRDVEGGVFEELAARHPTIEPLRRALQRSFIERLNEQLLKSLSPSPMAGTGVATDFQPAAAATLRALAARIHKVLPKVRDDVTREHLQYCSSRIDAALQ